MVQQTQYMFAFMVAVVYFLLCMVLCMENVKPMVQNTIAFANPNHEYFYVYEMLKVGVSVLLTMSLLNKEFAPTKAVQL
jgi:hypothetical protein